MLKKILLLQIPWWKFLLAIIISSGILSLTGWLGKTWWIFDLTANFRVQYFTVQILILIPALLLRKNVIALIAGCFTLINFALIIPLYLPATKVNLSPLDDSVKIIYANVFTANTNVTALNELIERHKPDILILSEINDRWVRELNYLEKDFIFSRKFPRIDNFGIGIYSRIPLREFNKLYLGSARVPALKTTFYLNEQPITLFGLHALPPVSKNYFDERNKQLESLTTTVNQTKNAVIVIGDLNMTQWSPYFKTLIKQTGLKDSRQGFGLQPSWPSMLPVLFIPIDHCLVSPEIAVKSRMVGSGIGSDHYPVIVEVSLPGKRKKE